MSEASGLSGAPALAGPDVGVSRRSPAAQPRAAVSSGPAPVQEIVAVTRAAGTGAYGDRLRLIIVVLWRAALRVGEALALAETDLDPARGAVLVRAGRNEKRREVGLDARGWRTLDPWLDYRGRLPVGPLFCVLHGPSRGRPWSAAAVRRELRRAGARAGVAPPAGASSASAYARCGAGSACRARRRSCEGTRGEPTPPGVRIRALRRRRTQRSTNDGF